MKSHSVLAVALLLVTAFQLPLPALSEQVKQSMNTFADGSSNPSLFFSAPGNDTSLAIKIPKKVTLIDTGGGVGAVLEVTAKPYIWNESFLHTEGADFGSGSTAYMMDYNTSAGNLTLAKLHDDLFDDRSLDPKWKWFNPPSFHDEGNQTAGALRITAQANTDISDTQSNGCFLYQNSTAWSYNITLKVSGVPAHPGERAGILLRYNDSTFVELSYGNESGTAGLIRTNCTLGRLSRVTMPLEQNPIWLRINRGEGGFNSIRFYYSTDGSAWTPFSAASMLWNWSVWGDHGIGLAVMDGNSGAGYTADLDEFTVNRYNTWGWLNSRQFTVQGEVQAAELNWQATLAQNVFVYAKGSKWANWEQMTNHAAKNLSWRGDIFQYNVSFTSSFGDTTPFMSELAANYTIKDSPYNVSLDVGNDGTKDWSQVGFLPDKGAMLVNFTSALRTAIEAATEDGQGNVLIPLTISSEKKGTVTMDKLRIDYVLNSPPTAPVLDAPANATWQTTLNPTFNFSATDPDGGTLTYILQFYYQGSTLPFTRNQKTNSFGWSARNHTSGAQASFTFPSGDELIEGEHYLWRACAFDGWTSGPWSEMREFYIDTSPPNGYVVDDGVETDQPDRLHASLNITDLESGVVKYEYWLGTSPGSSNLSAPEETTVPDVWVENLTLIWGQKYYFTARALNGAGMWSRAITSDGITLKKGVINYIPSVAITAPAEGEEVSGLVVVKGTASDREFLDTLNVMVQVDNGEWLETEGNYTWRLSWDTTRAADGRHALTARAWDQKAYSPLAVVNVTVKNKHVIEILGFSPDPVPRISENESLEFNISARDPQDRELGYQWFVDGVPRVGADGPAFTYAAGWTSAGVHRIMVSTFAGTLEANHTFNLTVLNVNRRPVPAMTSPTPGQSFQSGKAVTFDASGTSDPDTDDNLTYTWSFGDGTESQGKVVTHAFKKAGKFAVVLTVSDLYTSETAVAEVTVKGTEAKPENFLAKNGTLVFGIAFLVVVVIAAAVVLSRRKPAPKPKAPTGDERWRPRREEAEAAAVEAAPVEVVAEAEPQPAAPAPAPPAWAPPAPARAAPAGPVGWEDDLAPMPAEPPMEAPPPPWARPRPAPAAPAPMTWGPAPEASPVILDMIPLPQEEAVAAPAQPAPAYETAQAYQEPAAAPAPAYQPPAEAPAPPGDELSRIMAQLRGTAPATAPAPAGPAPGGEMEDILARLRGGAAPPEAAPAPPAAPRAPAPAGVPAEPPKPKLISCPVCKTSFRVSDARRPLKVKCPVCGKEGVLRK